MNDNPYSEEINRLALKKIARANESISLSREIQVFDYSKKTVTTTSTSMFSVGGDYIESYWNFSRIFLSAYTVNVIIQVLEAWASNVLVSYAALDIVFNAFYGSKIFSVRDWIWFDFNYFYTGIGGMAALATGNPSFFLLSITTAGWQ